MCFFNRSIGGTDGSVFSPYKIRNKQSVHTYYKDVCRKVRLDFEEEVKIYNDTMKAYRYSVPDDIYSYADALSENQCFCNMETGDCPPHGFFNVTPCSFGKIFFLIFANNIINSCNYYRSTSIYVVSTLLYGRSKDNTRHRRT